MIEVELQQTRKYTPLTHQSRGAVEVDDDDRSRAAADQKVHTTYPPKQRCSRSRRR